MQKNLTAVLDSVSNKIDNAIVTDVRAAPIEIIVVGAKYTGMSTVIGIIEKALIEAGISNVTVANEVETREARAAKIEDWKSANTEEENKRFFSKAITINEARVVFKE